MAEGSPKLNAAPALTAPLAIACKGYQKVTQVLAQYKIEEQLSKLSKNPAVERLNTQKELLLGVMGLMLVLHGSQFKNMLLCTQVVLAFLYDRVKGSLVTMYDDVQKVREKMKADEPAAEPKDTSDEQNKHAKKREAKKTTAGSEAQKEDAEVAKKVLKALDSERLSAAATEVLAAAMACILVIHGGLAQTVAVAHALVGLIAERAETVLVFPGFEDLQAWTYTLLRLALWAVILPMALMMAPLALALNAAACGAQLATEHGVRFLAAKGKVADADAFLGSAKGLQAYGGLVALGTFWQVWTWAAGGSIAWYFQFIYMPAFIAEALLGLF